MRFQVESNRRAKDVTGPAVTSCYMQKAASWLKPKAGATAYDIGMEYFTILR
jgi:hypothetical protein